MRFESRAPLIHGMIPPWLFDLHAELEIPVVITPSRNRTLIEVPTRADLAPRSPCRRFHFVAHAFFQSSSGKSLDLKLHGMQVRIIANPEVEVINSGRQISRLQIEDVTAAIEPEVVIRI